MNICKNYLLRVGSPSSVVQKRKKQLARRSSQHSATHPLGHPHAESAGTGHNYHCSLKYLRLLAVARYTIYTHVCTHTNRQPLGRRSTSSNWPSALLAIWNPPWPPLGWIPTQPGCSGSVFIPLLLSGLGRSQSLQLDELLLLLLLLQNAACVDAEWRHGGL
jgi:hypothetical protein